MKMSSSFSKYAIGFLLGCTAAPVLKSKLAQKAYIYLAAGAFIARDSIMEEVERIHATALDVAEDAKVLTNQYYEQRDCAEAEENGEDDE